MRLAKGADGGARGDESGPPSTVYPREVVGNLPRSALDSGCDWWLTSTGLDWLTFKASSSRETSRAAAALRAISSYSSGLYAGGDIRCCFRLLD